jgi:hypothetical protein
MSFLPTRSETGRPAYPILISTVKGPSELKLSISISPSKSVLALKEEIASKSDVEKDRQRLIFSGEWCLTRGRPILLQFGFGLMVLCRGADVLT